MGCYSVEPDPFPAPGLRIVAAARTDQGQERTDNQDSVLVANTAADSVWTPPAEIAFEAPSGAFYALVCDGMGGEAGGAIASRLAVETTAGAMQAAWARLRSLPPGSRALAEQRVSAALVSSLEAASARIKQVAKVEPIYARMGTTATLGVVLDDVFLCAQVGDSRAYVWSHGALVQITRDQTMQELLRSSGAVPDDQIANVVGPNVILQALGSSTRLDVVLSRAHLDDGDVVLLCSDGLHGSVSDDAIARILSDHVDPAGACDALVTAANANGGPDNISVVVFRVERPARG